MDSKNQGMTGTTVFRLILFFFIVTVTPLLFPHHAEVAWSLGMFVGVTVACCVPPFMSWRRNLGMISVTLICVGLNYWFSK